jgi:hypothetical protein
VQPGPDAASAAAVAPIVEEHTDHADDLLSGRALQKDCAAAAPAVATAVHAAAATAAGCTPASAVADAMQLRAAQQEVCQLLAAVCVMLRLGAAQQLPGALQALRALPELPEGEGRGLCSLCGHYEALTAYAVSCDYVSRVLCRL